VFGVVAAGDGAFADFVAGAGEGLAHLEGDGAGEVVGLGLEDAGEFAHAEGAMVEGDGREVGEGVGGDADLLVDGVGGQGREAAQKLAGGGIDGFDGHLPLQSINCRGRPAQWGVG